MNEIGSVRPRQRQPGRSDHISRDAGAGSPRRKLFGRILLTIALIAAFAGIAISLMRSHREAGDASHAARMNDAVPLVTTAPVGRRPMVRSLVVAGSLVARHELPVGAEISGGRIDAVLVDQGDHVAKGQALARFDSKVLEAQLRHAQAAAQDMAAAAASAEADFRRVDGIRGTGAVSTEQVGQRRAAAASAAARLAAAQAEASELEARLDQSVLRAPADGVIVARNAEPGAIVSPGGAPLFQLLEGGLVEFDAQVPQDQLQDLVPGMEVELGPELGTADREQTTGRTPTAGAMISGRIRAVAPTLDPQSRLGIVHIALPLDPNLRPGAFAQGRILLSRTPVLSVPLAAVLWQNGQSFVTVATGNHVQRRSVQTGATEAGRVEIRSGLTEGDHVVLSAAAFLHNGEVVREAPVQAAGVPNTMSNR
jgi:RND family efflux transporter MFP subunit